MYRDDLVWIVRRTSYTVSRIASVVDRIADILEYRDKDYVVNTVDHAVEDLRKAKEEIDDLIKKFEYLRKVVG
jgi:phage terminase Nu1 subunit (DNA packaging protein)